MKGGMICIESWNTGQKPGMLLEYQLLFSGPSDLNVIPMPLQLLALLCGLGLMWVRNA